MAASRVLAIFIIQQIAYFFPDAKCIFDDFVDLKTQFALFPEPVGDV